METKSFDSYEVVSTSSAPAPGGHYSQGIIYKEQLFVSGQLPIAVDGGPIDTTFEAQAQLALENVLAIVAAAGSGPDEVVKVTAYIVGIANWPKFNAVFAEMFGNARPARAVVPVPELHHGFLVEIEAIAAVTRPREEP